MPSPAALLALALILTATAAGAQTVCGDRDAIVRLLGEKYGETRQGGRLPNSRMPTELYANTATGTWSRLKSHSRGVSCLIAAGDGFETAPKIRVPEIVGTSV